MEFPKCVSKMKFNGNQNGWTNVCLHLSSMWITYPHLRLFHIFIGKWTSLSHFKMFYHIQWTTCTSNEFDDCFNNNKSLQRDKMNPLSRHILMVWNIRAPKLTSTRWRRNVNKNSSQNIFFFGRLSLELPMHKTQVKFKKKPLTLMCYKNILIPKFLDEIPACGI